MTMIEKDSCKKKNFKRHKRLSAGIRKFIRKEKARIRKENLDPKERDRLIDKLSREFIPFP